MPTQTFSPRLWGQLLLVANVSYLSLSLSHSFSSLLEFFFFSNTMPLLGGRPYPAYGELGNGQLGNFVVGTRRDVYRGVATMTPSGERRGDLTINARGRIVNAVKSEKARRKYLGPEGARLRARNACAAQNCATDAQLGQYGDVSYQPRGRQASSAARLAMLQQQSGMMVGNGYDIMGGKKGRGRRKAARFFKRLGSGIKDVVMPFAESAARGYLGI